MKTTVSMVFVSAFALLYFNSLAAAEVVPADSDGWTEFKTVEDAKKIGWSAMQEENPNLQLTDDGVEGGKAVRAAGWAGRKYCGLRFKPDFELPVYTPGMKLVFYMRAEQHSMYKNGKLVDNPDWAASGFGLGPVVIKVKFKNASITRALREYDNGPSEWKKYEIDLDITDAVTTADYYENWQKDNWGKPQLTNADWPEVEYFEWNSKYCLNEQDFIEVDKLHFEIKPAYLKVSYQLVPSRNYAVIKIDYFREIADESLTGLIELVNREGKIVVTQKVPLAAKTIETRLDYGGTEAGDYKCRVSVFSEKTQTALDQTEIMFRHPPKPEWLGNNIGIDPQRVLKPWTALECKDKTVLAWGRVVSWDKSILPNSITTQGREMLAEPMRLICRIEGEEQERISQLTDFKFTQKTTARVEMTAVGVIEHGPLASDAYNIQPAGEVHITVKMHMDFDGFLWTEMKFSDPEKAVKFKELRIDVPMSADNIRYYQFNSFDHAGAVGEKAIEIPWRQYRMGNPNPYPQYPNYYHWFGTEELGLGFAYSSLKDWKPNSFKNYCTFSPGEKVSVYTMNIRQSPVSADGLVYSFGLQATPIKPLPRDWHCRISDSASPGRENFDRDMNTPVDWVILWQSNYGFGTVFKGLHDTENWDAAAVGNAVERYHKVGIALVGPGCCPQKIQKSMSPFKDYFREWVRWPLDGNRWDDVWNYVDCPGAGSFMDFITWSWQKSLKKSNLDGVYFDGWLGGQISCNNPDHGHGESWVDDEGNIHGPVPLLEAREAMKRFAVMLEDTINSTFVPAAGSAAEDDKFPHYRFAVHSWEFVPPITGFATDWLTGEFVAYTPPNCLQPNQSYAQSMGIGKLKTRCLATNYGLPMVFDTLLQEGSGQADKQTKMAFAWFLPHGTGILPGGMNPQFTVRLYNVLGNFGARLADFTPAWRHGDNKYLQWASPVDENDVFATWQREGKVLAVLSNLRTFNGGETSHVTLQLKGFTDPKVTNALTQEQIPVKDNIITLDIEPETFVLVLIEKIL
ncbi:MAG: glycoside hydrolase domain-containing protein [Planctomycetota bacterium]